MGEYGYVKGYGTKQENHLHPENLEVEVDHYLFPWLFAFHPTLQTGIALVFHPARGIYLGWKAMWLPWSHLLIHGSGSRTRNNHHWRSLVQRCPLVLLTLHALTDWLFPWFWSQSPGPEIALQHKRIVSCGCLSSRNSHRTLMWSLLLKKNKETVLRCDLRELNQRRRWRPRERQVNNRFRFDRLEKKTTTTTSHVHHFFFPVTALLRHEGERSFTFRGRREHKSRRRLSFPELRYILLEFMQLPKHLQTFDDIEQDEISAINFWLSSLAV